MTPPAAPPAAGYSFVMRCTAYRRDGLSTIVVYGLERQASGPATGPAKAGPP